MYPFPWLSESIKGYREMPGAAEGSREDAESDNVQKRALKAPRQQRKSDSGDGAS